MNSFTEKTWTIVTFNAAVTRLMKTYQIDPPRKLQSEKYTGPMTIERFRKIEEIRAILEKKGIDVSELQDCRQTCVHDVRSGRRVAFAQHPPLPRHYDGAGAWHLN